MSDNEDLNTTMSVHSDCTPNMRRNLTFFAEHDCAVKNAAKLLLFLSLSTAILYIPLGRITYCEPYCDENYRSRLTLWDADNTSAMCCLCDMYKMAVRFLHSIFNGFVRSLKCINMLLLDARMKVCDAMVAMNFQNLHRIASCDGSDMKSCKICKSRD